MTLDRTKKHVAAGCEWTWDNISYKWRDEYGQRLFVETLLLLNPVHVEVLLNPVPVEEMEPSTETVTAKITIELTRPKL